MQDQSVGLGRGTTIGVLVAAVAVIAAGVALWLFPRAMPMVTLTQTVTRAAALSRGDSFFLAHDLAPPAARTAVRFQSDDPLSTYVELAGGGHDPLNALVAGKDVAPYSWSVRAFVAGNPREASVDFAPDGRVLGFSRTFAETDARPDVGADSARVLAERTLTGWVGERMDRWKFVTSSYETMKTSGRVDRRFTFERTDRTVAGAPIRVIVEIAGDTPSGISPFVEIPQAFRRRYQEMRSANDLFEQVAGLGALAIGIAGLVFLGRSARSGLVRWRPALVVGGVIGGLAIASGLNEIPGSWFDYDTATSPLTFQAMSILGAIATGTVTALVVGLTLATAESAARQAFPLQLDWWKLWRFRGTREVAARVAGGYAASCLSFAYVAVFYIVTRKLLGWWVPSELLDDPNQLASPMPWISGIASSLQAGVWEESLFRALPLSLLSLWVAQRVGRQWWMAAGVVLTALVFGFAHSNYESWPPYSRGVEIFLDACFWAVLFLNFGLIVTVVAHFVYDLVLFGLFAASGSAATYHTAAAIIGVALLAPALAVAWKWLRQGGLVTAPEEARFGAPAGIRPDDALAFVAAVPHPVLSMRARPLTMVALAIGVIVAVGRPPQPTLGPAFTVGPTQLIHTSDSVVSAHGGDPAGWRRLTTTGTSDLAEWPRFVNQYQLIPRAQSLAATYVPPAWWIVRYVHPDGTTPQQRAEEWRIRLWPDGRPLDAHHVLDDSAYRPPAEPAEVRRIAQAALTQDGMNRSTLHEVEFTETARPSRKDVTVTYTDSGIVLPAGAAARAFVQVAGNEALVARRTVELSEQFLRADRERQTNHFLIAGLCGVVLFGGILVGAIIVIRRRPPLIMDGLLDRRQTFLFVATVTGLALVDRLNGLPSALAEYDTAQPWSRFTGSMALGAVAVLVSGLAVVGVWLGVGALRRRVGIPMVAAPGGGGSPSGDVLTAGLGLGGTLFGMSQLNGLIETGSRHLPAVPTTMLDRAWPWLGPLPDLVSSTVMSVAGIAIVLLVVAGLTHRWWLRGLMGVVMIALAATIAATLTPSTETGPLMIALALVRLALIAGALYSWGMVSAWSWFVASLTFNALGALRMSIYAPTGQEHVAGALTLMGAAALVWMIVRHTRLVRGNAAGNDLRGERSAASAR